MPRAAMLTGRVGSVWRRWALGYCSVDSVEISRSFGIFSESEAKVGAHSKLLVVGINTFAC